MAHHALLIRNNVHIRIVCVCIFSSFVYTSCVTMPGPLNPKDGLTPLMLAAQFGNLSVAKLLVEMYSCDLSETSNKVSGKDAQWEE